MRAECLKVAGKHGVEIAADETYGPGDTDMTAQLSKIKAAGVQAVLNAGFGQGPAIVTKNYRQLGLTLPLYQSHGVASKQYVSLSGDAAEGVRLPAAALLVADTLPDADPQKKVVVSYKRDYEARFKQEVSTFGGHAYDGLMLAVDAMRRAGSTEKSKVRDALEATRGYVGTGGVVNMSAQDHMGLDLSAFRMLEVRKGDWALVK
jgi:branched-chain amino acid transport system substrate-binding protein